MLNAVLFDWGNTLMRDSWNEEITRAANAAGLAALAEREDLPDVEAIADWWARTDHPLHDVRREAEPDLLELHRSCFADLGVTLADEEVHRYYTALHRSWTRTIAVPEQTHALLEALRERGLKLGIVSNVATPGSLIRELLEEQGIADRVDTIVLSCEIGKRKPHRAIFERALADLEAEPSNAMHVGDRRYDDVGGASRVGVTTVQALWFFADDDEEGPEPDHQAFEMLDVLDIADRLRAGN